jgi:hypothetical protein
MDQPNPNDGQGDPNAGGRGSSAKAPAVKLLDVVKFTHHDIITGRDVDKIGLVVRADKDDPTVAVRPLEHHFHEVDPAELSVINAADFD